MISYKYHQNTNKNPKIIRHSSSFQIKPFVLVHNRIHEEKNKRERRMYLKICTSPNPILKFDDTADKCWWYISAVSYTIKIAILYYYIIWVIGSYTCLQARIVNYTYRSTFFFVVIHVGKLLKLLLLFVPKCNI